MSNTYKLVTVVGSSKTSIDEAIKNGIKNCGEQDVNWFQIKEIRGHIGSSGGVGHYQVVMDIGCVGVREES